MIHSSDRKPRVYPFKGTTTPAQIDRLQDMTASVTLNRTKIEEIGRDGIVDWRKTSPTVTLALRQLEYGTMEFWQMLANTSTSDTKIEWKDFKTPQVDIAAYSTDDNDSFKSTVWYKNFRLSSFNINIGDPDSIVERTFNLIGEDEITWQGDNKYLIVLQDDTASGSDHTITIGSGAWSNYPVPVADPDASGAISYIAKLVKVTSAEVTSELEYSTDFTYDEGTNTITIPGSASGDTFKVTYTAGSYITGATTFTNNDTDAAGLVAENCSIYLETSRYLYRLQSVGIDVTFDRMDVKEIGNQNVVQRGIRDITSRITLGRILEEYTIEEVLRGKAEDYGKLDVRQFLDEVNLIVKIYSDSDKNVFRMGYKFTDLAPTSVDGGTPLNDYVTRGVTLEGESGFVTDDESEL